MRPARSRIPFLVFGDGPRLTTGLARIARDITRQLRAAEDRLGIRVLQVGVDDVVGWQWQEWPFWGFQPNYLDQGRGAVTSALQTIEWPEGAQCPIVLAVCDPARVYDLTRWEGDGSADPADALLTERVDVWGYFPIDAHNIHGALGGPAREAVSSVDRVLAYTKFGSEVLEKTLQGTRRNSPEGPIAHLPHGIDTTIFHPAADDIDEGFAGWFNQLPHGVLVVGCVATNQPRKDLSLLFAAVAELRGDGNDVAVWLHTDRLTDAWDIGELVSTFNLPRDRVLVSLDALPDAQLAGRYRVSHVTYAPGLGEGFGYPIAESLACGTPVVHGHYAGGVELIAAPEWLVEPFGWRIESVYALMRPVFKPSDVAFALKRACAAYQAAPEETQAFCAGSVQHLSWRHLWPAWLTWIEAGIAPDTWRDRR